MNPRVGIIGCGQISQFHFDGYVKAGATVGVACDTCPEAAARYGVRVETDWRRVIESRDIDLVSVLTPATTHREIVLAALAAGKGVVCEKTLTDDPAASWEIVQAARQPGAFVMTAYMKRFFPAAQKAKELLAELGPIISLYARSWQPFPALWDNPPPAAFTAKPSPLRAAYGGGVLVCGGSHILDLIHWYGGRPTQVCGQQQSRPCFDFDVQTNAQLWLPEGGVAHFEALWHPFAGIGYERNGWDERLEINTLRGRLELSTVLWNQPERNGALLIHHDAATGQVTEYRYPPVNTFHVEIADAVRRFRAGESPTPSAADGYVVDELIAAITASAVANQVRPIQWR